MFVNCFFAILVLTSTTTVLLAQEPNDSQPADAGIASNAASRSIELPVLPSGKYAFLARMPQGGEFGEFEPTAPYTWIEAEWTEVKDASRGELDVHHRFRLCRNRSASLITSSISKADPFAGRHKDVVTELTHRRGAIDERQYARICLMLEQLRVGETDCKLGRIQPEENPFGVNESILRVHTASSDATHEYRNDDDGVGDYRYWLVQTVIKQQAREDIWWKVPPKEASEPPVAPKPAIGCD